MSVERDCRRDLDGYSNSLNTDRTSLQITAAVCTDRSQLLQQLLPSDGSLERVVFLCSHSSWWYHFCHVFVRSLVRFSVRELLVLTVIPLPSTCLPVHLVRSSQWSLHAFSCVSYSAVRVRTSNLMGILVIFFLWLVNMNFELEGIRKEVIWLCLDIKFQISMEKLDKTKRNLELTLTRVLCWNRTSSPSPKYKSVALSHKLSVSIHVWLGRARAPGRKQ